MIPLLLLTNVLFNTLENYYVAEKIKTMSRQANIISTNLSEKGFDKNSTNFKEYVSEIESHEYGSMVILDGRGTVIYDSNQTDLGRGYATAEVINALEGNASTYNNRKENVARVNIPIGNKEEVLGVIILTSSYNDIDNTINEQKNVSYLIMATLFFILIFILSYYFSGFITKPFKRLLISINKITDGNLDEKIDIKGNYEIEEIGTAFNHMTDKLERIDENRRQFVANVSHELKTPLSSVKVLADSLLMQPDAPKELYKEFFVDISREIERETIIIDDLLTLVTLDKKENELNVSEANLNILIESIMKRLKPLADIKGVEMVFESYREVIAEVDKTKNSPSNYKFN